MSDYGRYPVWRQSSPSSVWEPVPSTRPPRVCIVTDSASDILPSYARAIGVVVIPSWLIMDGARLRDGVDITASQFYARLPRLHKPPYTEPASAQEFYYTYQEAFRQGATAIISVHVSSLLSKLVQNAVAATQAFPHAAIDVIDSQQAGIGMWPAVIRASQLAYMGAPIHVLHETITSILARTRLYALVESLDQLRRNGRISRARELLGTMLDAHPIITIEHGEVTPVETVRPRARGLLRLRELVREAGEIETLLVCGTTIEAIGQIESVLAEWYPGAIQKTWLGPAIGANTGPCVAVAVVTRQ